MNVGGVEFTAGPSLIIVVVVLVALTAYQALTSGRDKQKADTAIASIRRCPECEQVVGKAATTCRHCEADLSHPA